MIYGLGRLGVRLDDHQPISMIIKDELMKNIAAVVRNKIVDLLNSGRTSSHSSGDGVYDAGVGGSHHPHGGGDVNRSSGVDTSTSSSSSSSSPPSSSPTITISSMQSISNIMYGLWKMNIQHIDLPAALVHGIIRYYSLSIQVTDGSFTLTDNIRFLHAFNKLFYDGGGGGSRGAAVNSGDGNDRRGGEVDATSNDLSSTVTTENDMNMHDRDVDTDDTNDADVHHLLLADDAIKKKLLMKILSSFFYHGRPCSYHQYLIMNNINDNDIVAMLQDLSKAGITASDLDRMIITTTTSSSSSTLPIMDIHVLKHPPAASMTSSYTSPSSIESSSYTSSSLSSSSSSSYGMRYSKYIASPISASTGRITNTDHHPHRDHHPHHGGSDSGGVPASVRLESASHRMVHKLLLHLIPSIHGIKALSIVLQSMSKMGYRWKDLSMSLRKCLMLSLCNNIINTNNISNNNVGRVDIPSYLSIIMYALGKLNAPWRELDQYVYIVDAPTEGVATINASRGDGNSSDSSVFCIPRIDFHLYSSSRSVDQMDLEDDDISMHHHHQNVDDDNNNGHIMDHSTSLYASPPTITMMKPGSRSISARQILLSSLSDHVMVMTHRQLATLLYGLKELGAVWKDLYVHDGSDGYGDDHDDGNDRSGGNSLLQSRLLDRIEQHLISSEGWSSQGYMSVRLGLQHLVNSTITLRSIRQGAGEIITDGVDSDVAEKKCENSNEDDDDQMLYHYISLLRKAWRL